MAYAKIYEMMRKLREADIEYHHEVVQENGFHGDRLIFKTLARAKKAAKLLGVNPIYVRCHWKEYAISFF